MASLKYTFALLTSFVFGMTIVMVVNNMDVIRKYPACANAFEASAERRLRFVIPEVPKVKPRMRIICLILTSVSGEAKMNAVNNTWSRRCDKRLFLYSNASKAQQTPYTLKLAVLEGRDHLTSKMRAVFTHVYNTYNDTYDWILKCDDDTYVIMENLRHLLSTKDPRKARFLGYRMKPNLPDGFMSGGAGYVLSSKALEAMVNIGFRYNACSVDGGMEDVNMAKCLAFSNVTIDSSVGEDGKETFHPAALSHHLLKTEITSWLKTFAYNRPLPLGSQCCSQHSITFHYVNPNDMYIYEQLIYNTSVFSVNS